jgi:general nucleoside transport system permease protein
MTRPNELPRWVEFALLPLLNLVLALLVAGVLVAIIGEDPWRALVTLVSGAVGNGEFLGYTLYYTTDFIFTGLAVAIAFHAGLFNIGGDGQAYIGGLGLGLVCLALGGWPLILVLPIAILAAAAFGAAWAYVPAVLQAYRGSHVVITTIMFNFIAAALMQYLMVEVLIKPGQQSPESREFDPSTWLPRFNEAAAWFGLEVARSPLNLSFLWALAMAAFVWMLVWRTRWGYALRAVGRNESAAVYGGIVPARIIIMAMALSGALAGFLALNQIMGVQHRLLLNFTGGAGFVGIAVALMGRNHPIGICLAALLFGALYQGGAELAFEMPHITRDMVVAIQGLVILFCGALEFLFAPAAARLFRRRSLAPAAGQ